MKYCTVLYCIMLLAFGVRGILNVMLSLLILQYQVLVVLSTMYVCMYVWSSHIAEYGQPGEVANPARGQLNRENSYSPVPVRACLRIWSRETGSAVPSRVSLLISILRLNLI